jgi:leucyl/phenylalanyl-tRNA--protein transferase
MFADVTDASKIALAALVGHLLRHEVEMIDCQQNTSHLASLGGREIARKSFLGHVREAVTQTPIPWRFDKSALLDVLPDPIRATPEKRAR